MHFLFSFFQDGLKAVDNLKPSIEKLATDLHTVREAAAPVSSSLHSTLTFLSHMHHMCFPVFSIFPLRQIKQVQDEERKQLTQLRDVLKSALQVEQKEVTRKHTQFLYELNMSVKYHILISYKSALKSYCVCYKQS